jgi:hypothetical protein
MATLARARVMEPKARWFIPIQDADQRLVELLLARARGCWLSVTR